MLAFIVAANRLSGGDPKFKTAFNYLVDKHGYGTNMINQKITIPNDDNFSGVGVFVGLCSSF